VNDKDLNRFEALADIDLDGSVMEVGIQHFAMGPAGLAIRFNTGALEVSFGVHMSDLREMIEALTAAEKQMAKLEAKRLRKMARAAR
jgi:hypothetical protein